MTTCELIPQAVQQFLGGVATTTTSTTGEENLAIVPDIHSFSFAGSSDVQSCSNNNNSNKRSRVTSECLSIEGELELLSQQESQQLSGLSFPEPKRHCSVYSISSSPNQFQIIGSPDSIEEFDLEVKENYNFTEDADIFTCGGNSPIRSSTSITDFTSTTSQAAAGCNQEFGPQSFISVNPFESNMHRQSQTALSHPLAQHGDKYELVITEQPEEVRML